MKVQLIIAGLFSLLNGHVQTNNQSLFRSDNPLIQYTGRIDFSNPGKPRFWNPGTYITIRFKGTFCNVLINDEMLNGKNHNYLEIILDKQKPERLKLKSKENNLLIGEHIKDTIHTLVITKNTEAGIGYLEFTGIRCRQLLPVKLPSRKIECIGNSITCGAGSDTSAFACGQGEWYDQHNAYMSYGPVTARALNAQYYITAVSGIGLTHSCCKMDIVMPQVFDKISTRENKITWDFKKYQPDVVTICLGQNDGIQDSAVFCKAYTDFIGTIRKVYPGAQIIALTSPMAAEFLKTRMVKYLTAIMEYEKEHSDPHVHLYIFPQDTTADVVAIHRLQNTRKFPPG